MVSVDIQTKPMRLAFMGTPQFAATVLETLTSWDKGSVVAVYCQPDRPVGRGHKIQFSPVKELAINLCIPVQQPINFKEEQELQRLREYKPDFLIVVAYGLILPQSVLDIPSVAAINIHASLLPFYRGAAPIQRSIIAGELVTGVTIMRMEQGLDTGPIYAQRSLAIGVTDTAGTIHDQLAVLGGKLLLQTLDLSAAGHLPAPIPQDDTRATYAEKLFKSDGYIQWDTSAQHIHNLIRGVTPWPGARTQICFDKKDAIPIIVAPGKTCSFELFKKIPLFPGKVLGFIDEGIAIACLDGVYLVEKLCPAGSKFMSAKEFWNGYIQGEDSVFCCSLKK